MSKKTCCSYPFRIYHEGYDSYYCPFCDSWLERSCQDENCSFCRNRPNQPSLTNDYHQNTLEFILNEIREVFDYEESEETSDDGTL